MEANSQPPPQQQQAATATATAKAGIPENILRPWKLPRQISYVFKNANVIDAANGCVIPNQTVRLSNGLIHSVGDSDSTQLSTGDVVIDLDGKYICPGLMDCHVHLCAVPGEEGLLAGLLTDDVAISYFRQPFVAGKILSRGFTTVRDTGGATLALKEAIEQDVITGPRMFISITALSQTGGHGDARSAHQKCCGNFTPIAQVIDGVPDCLRVTRDQIRQGADFIKIMASGGVASPTDKIENVQFTADEIKAITDAAEGFGTYVTAHAYTPKSIQHAINNGVMGIEHGNFLDEETARLMAKKGVWFTPTLVTYDAMGSDKYSGFLPPANRIKNREVLDKGLDSLRIAEAAGVTMCHGTDLLGPLWEEQSREFGLRAKVLSSKTILQGATVNPARMLGQEKSLGQIKDGFIADLLILNKNPLEDITVLDEPDKHMLAVLKNGRVYTSRWSGLPEDVHEAKVMIQ